MNNIRVNTFYMLVIIF